MADGRTASGRPLRVNVVSWESGGLGVDIDILSAALGRAGCTVAFKERSRRRPAGRLPRLLQTAGALSRRAAARAGLPSYDVNIFIESVFPEHLPMARQHCLFVNPEWFRDDNLPHLPRLRYLLCKSADGVAAMRPLGVPCRDVGFSSPDRRLPTSRDGALQCLHVAGQSAVKGSEAVVDVWARHPEWPMLTVVRRHTGYGGGAVAPLRPLPNVEYLTDRVADDALRALQNRCAVHVQPSLAEGYGHVIGEAMSCGAVVITTDAAPMNQLVGPDRGRLVGVARVEAQHRSQLHYVDLDDLERVLAATFAMSAAERDRLGAAARHWYEAQGRRFDAAIRTLVADLAQASHA